MSKRPGDENETIVSSSVRKLRERWPNDEITDVGQDPPLTPSVPTTKKKKKNVFSPVSTAETPVSAPLLAPSAAESDLKELLAKTQKELKTKEKEGKIFQEKQEKQERELEEIKKKIQLLEEKETSSSSSSDSDSETDKEEEEEKEEKKEKKKEKKEKFASFSPPKRHRSPSSVSSDEGEEEDQVQRSKRVRKPFSFLEGSSDRKEKSKEHHESDRSHRMPREHRTEHADRYDVDEAFRRSYRSNPDSSDYVAPRESPSRSSDKEDDDVYPTSQISNSEILQVVKEMVEDFLETGMKIIEKHEMFSAPTPTSLQAIILHAMGRSDQGLLRKTVLGSEAKKWLSFVQES